MKFAFPKDKKTESVNISVYKTDIDKIRKLAELNNCSQVDVYKTIVSEAIEEYEEKFGKLDGKKATPSFSVKRDFVEAGDNRRKEVSGDEFDGGGDLRTKEAKKVATENEAKKEETIDLQPQDSATDEQVSLTDQSEFEEEDYTLACEECGKTPIEYVEENEINDSLYCDDCAKKIAVGKIKHQKEYQENYYQENKEELYARKQERRAEKPMSEREKATRAAYMKKYHAEHPRDRTVEKLPKEWWKEENLPIGAAQQIQNNARAREEEHLTSSIAYCTNKYCTAKPKFIRGMGMMYKGKEFCSDQCLEKYINGGQEAISN